MQKAPEKILLVDDDVALLDALRRVHRKHFDLTVATSGRAALEVIARDGPFDVIVSDYQMPEMTGASLLAKVAETAPEMVRVMLTGNADLGTAMDAVNNGQVFRYVTKPCSQEDFSATLDQALEQVRLRRAERDLLENTLKGSIEVLTEVLALSNPEAFGRATRVRSYVRSVLKRLGVRDGWQYESAALLSQIGWVAIPSDLIENMAAGEELSHEQMDVVERHAEISGRILKKIPRLERVAGIIERQRARHDELNREANIDPVVARGSQILAVCVAFDELLSLGANRTDALAALASNQGAYNPYLLDILAEVKPIGEDANARSLRVAELCVGMILDQDVRSSNGKLIVTKGNRVTHSMLERLHNYWDIDGVREPIRVLVLQASGSVSDGTAG